MGYKSKWSGLNEDTAREYYFENYEGLSRGELEKKDGGFYRALRDKELLDILPESKWSWLNEETAKEYYSENHEGVSRGELAKEDSGFYMALYTRGLLDIAFRPFYNMEEFNEHLEESGLLEDLFDDHEWVKDVDKFSEIVKEYCKYNCQPRDSLGDELGIKRLNDKLNLTSSGIFHPEEIDLITKYMQNPENDRWKEYSLESEL
jgi:hypothetical protein